MCWHRPRASFPGAYWIETKGWTNCQSLKTWRVITNLWAVTLRSRSWIIWRRNSVASQPRHVVHHYLFPWKWIEQLQLIYIFCFDQFYFALCKAKFLEDEIKERKAMLAKTEHDIVKVVEDYRKIVVDFLSFLFVFCKEKEAARKEHKKLRAQPLPQLI